LDTQPVEACNSFPVILGRPFLATPNALINCRNGHEAIIWKHDIVDEYF
jgi:hypothetical protein